MDKRIEAILGKQSMLYADTPGQATFVNYRIDRAGSDPFRPGPSLVVPLAELESETAPEAIRAEVRPMRRMPVRSILTDVDRDQIIRALEAADGRVGGPNGAASRVGLKRTTFITRMKKLGIVPDRTAG